MENLANQEQSIELLQQLGLKEYEAKSFVALSRLPQGTAKEISEISEVPRTRVYDSIRVLEQKGLVEIHHSNPKQFRTVSIDEAVNILKSEYVTRIESLRESLTELEPAGTEDETEITHEVWALSGGAAIEARTEQLIGEAEGELIMVVGHEGMLTDGLIDALQAAIKRDVSVVVGVVDESLRETLIDAVPQARVFISELSWLESSPLRGDETQINRLLLIDRSTILASSTHEPDAPEQEKAVFGKGFNNGLVTIVRRLMATGLLSEDDPGEAAA
jgi:sugar-specific transcriptional regulator TrmB